MGVVTRATIAELRFACRASYVGGRALVFRNRIRDLCYHARVEAPREQTRAQRPWTFLTNHGHVLVCIAQDHGVRGRDIAQRVGITERAAQSIIADLVAAGYVRRTRMGRHNHYQINPDLPVRHPVEQSHRVGELLAAVAEHQEPSRGG